MNDVTQDLKREKGKYQDVAFKIFAVVGFLSSVVTIFSWFSSTQAALSTTINSTTIEIPGDVRISALSDSGYGIDAAKKDITQKYCDPVEVDFNGEKSKNFFFDQERCDGSKKFFSAASRISELSGKKLVAWDVSITNDGRDAAENVTLRSPVPVDVRGSDGDGNAIEIEATPSKRVFSLPDLNPKDTLELRIISSTPVPERYEPEVGSPKITFAGGAASTRQYIRVGGRYASIVEFLDELPTIFQVIVIFVGALFLTLIWLVPIALLSDAQDKRKANSAASGDAADK